MLEVIGVIAILIFCVALIVFGFSFIALDGFNKTASGGGCGDNTLFYIGCVLCVVSLILFWWLLGDRFVLFLTGG